MNKYFAHLKTITLHKFYVMIYCFKVGLIRQGLAHDLSKYTPIEFLSSVQYYQGDKSPILAEKAKKGYSEAWLHHKGANKHHWDYWVDFSKGELKPAPMPTKYICEMICDWLSAEKAYNGKKNREQLFDGFKTYYFKNGQFMIFHDETKKLIDVVMNTANSEKEVLELLKNYVKYYNY